MTDAAPFGSRGSLYEFVRRALAERGGRCTRAELLAIIEEDPASARRLQQSQGFSRPLQNMKHSGFIELDGEIVRRTARRVGRRRF
ncbi:MAG: hypothetical protein V4499_02880 [Pseudomonadota bacterium]